MLETYLANLRAFVTGWPFSSEKLKCWDSRFSTFFHIQGWVIEKVHDDSSRGLQSHSETIWLTYMYTSFKWVLNVWKPTPSLICRTSNAMGVHVSKHRAGNSMMSECINRSQHWICCQAWQWQYGNLSYKSFYYLLVGAYGPRLRTTVLGHSGNAGCLKQIYIFY